jgi:hypothetical protein
MIIYIDGKLDRDSLTYDEAVSIEDAAPVPPLPLLWWFLFAMKHEQPTAKAA